MQLKFIWNMGQVRLLSDFFFPRVHFLQNYFLTISSPNFPSSIDWSASFNAIKHIKWSAFKFSILPLDLHIYSFLKICCYCF